MDYPNIDGTFLNSKKTQVLFYPHDHIPFLQSQSHLDGVFAAFLKINFCLKEKLYFGSGVSLPKGCIHTMLDFYNYMGRIC